jgi:hypothetical protein
VLLVKSANCFQRVVEMGNAANFSDVDSGNHFFFGIHDLMVARDGNASIVEKNRTRGEELSNSPISFEKQAFEARTR